MKNFYNITKGQLITLLIFGGIGWVVALTEIDYEDSAVFFAILIPAILIFYTIGWKNKANIRDEK